MLKLQPIKRIPALRHFSRDHHFSLLLVWKIRQGLILCIEPKRISNYINFFFENYLDQHLKEEEEYLFLNLNKNNDLRKIAEEDHTAIREMALSIKSQPHDTSLFNRLAERLEKHIRFEERQLFNELQNTLNKSEFNIIEKKMAVSHHDIKDDDWKDVFWLKA